MFKINKTAPAYLDLSVLNILCHHEDVVTDNLMIQTQITDCDQRTDVWSLELIKMIYECLVASSSSSSSCAWFKCDAELVEQWRGDNEWCPRYQLQSAPPPVSQRWSSCFSWSPMFIILSSLSAGSVATDSQWVDTEQRHQLFMMSRVWGAHDQ